MKYIYDMGFEQFEQNPKLSKTLSFSLINGLLNSDLDWLLCDFSGGAKKYSAKDILCYSLGFAEILKSMNLDKRVAIALPPQFLAFVANYACVFAKIVPVNINFTLGHIAAKSCFETANINTTITIGAFKDKITSANPQFPWSENIIDIAQLLSGYDFSKISKLIDNGLDAICEAFDIQESSNGDVEGTLVFTSGSEGSPKAAILTERNIIANCLQTKLSEVFVDDILLANLPIFHSFGLLFETWYMAMHSQKTVTLYSPLDIKNNIKAIKEIGVTAIIGSPTFFRAYVKYASSDDMKSIRKAIAGAEKTPNGFHDTWDNLFNNSFFEGYGLTEATPVVGVNLPNKDFGYYSTGYRRGSIGKLYVGMRAKILDPTTLEELPFGEQGLLAMQGANIFAGYLNNKEATDATLIDNWLVTGDLSRIDSEGFLFIDGRLSRFSKIGGEMVPHATVESTLNTALGFANNDIALLAISSRLDEGKGEALVMITTTDVTLAEAKEVLKSNGISNLWNPKYIVKVDSIPLLPSGKLDLKTLSKIAKG